MRFARRSSISPLILGFIFLSLIFCAKTFYQHLFNVFNSSTKPGLTSTLKTSSAMALEARDNEFFLNGKSLRILSGAMHYFRVLPQYWSDRMRKMKACGLNTLETFVI